MGTASGFRYGGLILAAALAACSPISGPQFESKGVDIPVEVTEKMRADIESAIRSRLKDPESARFGVVYASQDKTGAIFACGVVNARNSFGGYVGDKPYVVGMSSDGFVLDASIAGGENSVFAHLAMCRSKNLPI